MLNDFKDLSWAEAADQSKSAIASAMTPHWCIQEFTLSSICSPGDTDPNQYEQENPKLNILLHSPP